MLCFGEERNKAQTLSCEGTLDVAGYAYRTQHHYNCCSVVSEAPYHLLYNSKLLYNYQTTFLIVIVPLQFTKDKKRDSFLKLAGNL